MTSDANRNRWADRKGSARRIKDQAYVQRTAAEDTMNKARDAANQAYQDKEVAYRNVLSTAKQLGAVRAEYGPQLNILQPNPMVARENSAKIEQLMGLIRAASNEWDAAVKVHAAATHEFESKRQAFIEARTAFEAAQRNQRAALASYKGVQAIQAEFFGEETQTVADKLKLLESARRAGVPEQFVQNARLVKIDGGGYELFFGGKGRATGPGHGHTVINQRGGKVYSRGVHEPRGMNNYDYRDREFKEFATKLPRTGEYGFFCRFETYEAYIETNLNGFGKQQIDIYYGPEGPFDPQHYHATALRSDPLNIRYNY